MKFSLRPYQKAFCRSVVNGFTLGVAGQPPFTRQLGVAATGAGKTIMASALIWWMHQRGHGKTLMLADTDELVQQAVDKIIQSTGLIPDVEKAARRAMLNSNVVVGSIQTMARRHERFPAEHWKLIIADEAHLSMSDSWQKVLKRCNEAGAWILGITATPERGDGQRLMEWYQNLAAEIGLFDLINEGHLAPITVQVCPIEIDATHLKAKTRGKDKGNFDAEELTSAIEPYWEKIIEEWKAHAQDRKTLIFHPSIRSSERFAEMMRNHGIQAAHVAGVSRNRREILDDFGRGNIQVLNNAQLLTKGYDCPDIGCVINLRPTKSRTQYLQMIGRGTRTCPGKTDLLLLDFLWQFQELGVMRPAALYTEDEKKEEKLSRALKDGKAVRLEELDLRLQAAEEEKIIRKFQLAAAKARRMKYDARELATVLHQPDLIDYRPVARWEKLRMTTAQRRILEKAGIDVSSVGGLGHAARIIEALTARRRQGMADPELLQRLLVAGVPNASEMRFSEAQAALKTEAIA